MDGRAAVKSGYMWGYIDSEGTEIVPPKFLDANDYSEGLAAVQIGGKIAYIDKQW